MPPATIEVELDHVRLSALTWGPAQGPLALLLHGFPDSAHTWRHLGPVLAAEGWRVVAPFTRGYAPSSVPADGRSDVGALMDDAVGLHAALGGDELCGARRSRLGRPDRQRSCGAPRLTLPPGRVDGGAAHLRAAAARDRAIPSGAGTAQLVRRLQPAALPARAIARPSGPEAVARLVPRVRRHRGRRAHPRGPPRPRSTAARRSTTTATSPVRSGSRRATAAGRRRSVTSPRPRCSTCTDGTTAA